MTHGLSAREAAEQIIRTFPSLLGRAGAAPSTSASASPDLDWNEAGLGSLGLSH
jgi:hypothetical protein